ncbi:MAG: hypothetical protein MUP27_15240, partial [Desulfobacterales bacterium]|nr:hypothetical protein [Desulfobacterales bacterium]
MDSYLSIEIKKVNPVGYKLSYDLLSRQSINPHVAKKPYNPADRNAGKAFHLPARSRFGEGRAAT